jgi:carboxypeptidase Taq
MTSDYTRLAARMQKISHISNALSILHWDNSTYMPVKSAPSRAEELATLSGMAHAILVDSETKDLIEAAKENLSNLNDWEKANLREIERNYIHASAMSEDLVMRHSKACSDSEMKWRSARKANDFKSLAPYLEEVLTLTKEIAIAKSEKLSLTPHDALMDQHSPGLRSKDVEVVFAILKSKIPAIITEAIKKQASQKIILIGAAISVERQKELTYKIAKMLGFDFDKGRLDISAHPFCSGTADDVRLTTRYYEHDPFVSIMGTIHETGHGLYELSRPEKYRSQPVGKAAGMAVHESQSLIMEMQVSRTMNFCKFLSRVIKSHCEKDLVQRGNLEADSMFSATNIYNIVNKVEPGLIRVDADEVTYPMHVILRFEIEQDLLAGNMRIKDLPEIWKNKMKSYLGVDVLNDMDGCMQDIHWPSGSFGYFPSYTYGAMIAAQLFDQAVTENPAIVPEFETGNVSSLNEFLNKNLRAYGRLYEFDDLMVKATGKKLDPEIFVKYLEGKYL